MHQEGKLHASEAAYEGHPRIGTVSSLHQLGLRPLSDVSLERNVVLGLPAPYYNRPNAPPHHALTRKRKPGKDAERTIRIYLKTISYKVIRTQNMHVEKTSRSTDWRQRPVPCLKSKCGSCSILSTDLKAKDDFLFRNQRTPCVGFQYYIFHYRRAGSETKIRKRKEQA
ncbi:hypothetical protein RRG08_009201 [Elysia crispata]|uniref:Uncharacterized protein n=1 Tax=Elysia crispata TaxID=231223 RepID=A0AAE1DBF7_9GAST|nr:hypothetical protein RRG08_009201 [Elysia crispata]